MKWSKVMLVTALALIPASRTIPSLLNNAVFSTDSWPLIRLTQLVVENPWIRVLSLGNRHAKWPSATLFSAVFTEVTGVGVYDFYAFLGAPLMALALAILLYAVLGGVSEGFPRAMSLLALLVYPSFTLFTSAYLKEVYAYPLALLLLYFTLRASKLPKWIGVLIASITLVLSHPLTPLVVIAYSLTLIYVELVDELKAGVKGGVGRWWSLLVTAILTSTLYALHASSAGPAYVFTSLDIAVLLAYAAFTYTTYFLLRGSGWGFCIFALLVALASVIAYSALIEGVPIGLSIIPYCLPIVLLLTGLREQAGGGRGSSAPLLLPLGTGVLYTLTYAKWLSSITHRFLNYLVIPLALSIGKYSGVKPRLAALITLILVFSGFVATLNASTGRDPLLFYWRCSEVDVALEEFIEKYSARSVLAGAKYSYMLGEELTSTGLDVVSALRSCASTSGALLVISYEELVHGVPFSPLHYVKPVAGIFNCKSLVYSSLENYVLVN